MPTKSLYSRPRIFKFKWLINVSKRLIDYEPFEFEVLLFLERNYFHFGFVFKRCSMFSPTFHRSMVRLFFKRVILTL